MNSIIIRVISNPNSKTSWIVYPNGMKPFVISKSKAKDLKPNKAYFVDLKTKSYAENTKTFVYAIKVHGELALKKGK
jgi:hypothetical protein